MKKKFEALTLSVARLHEEGYGLAELDGRKYGIFGALPGEDVVAMPFTRRKRRIFARTEEVIKPSAGRVEPACSVADVCGGCTYQHMAVAAQRDMKQTLLQELLAETPPLRYLPALAGPSVGYRAKARLGVKYVAGRDQVLVGFREKMKGFVTDTEYCPVLAEPMGQLLAPLASLIATLSVREALPQIELAVGETEAQSERAALIFRHLQPLSETDTDALIGFGVAHGIAVYVQPAGPESVVKLHPETGPARLYYLLPEYGLKMAFHPCDFTQVNADINRQMVPLALDLLNLQPQDRVMDLFCGIGNFTLPIAARVQKVCGMEGSAEAIDRAQENAVTNGVKNADFRVADLYKGGLVAEDLVDFDKVLIDPPRSGAEQVIQPIISSRISRIVYVSCNPVTLARDIGLLVGAGFQLESAGIIDMFPHTKHVESIACLSR